MPAIAAVFLLSLPASKQRALAGCTKLRMPQIFPRTRIGHATGAARKPPAHAARLLNRSGHEFREFRARARDQSSHDIASLVAVTALMCRSQCSYINKYPTDRLSEFAKQLVNYLGFRLFWTFIPARTSKRFLGE
ncbi:unnamed protein product, partial [Mycena citricolor]